MHVAVFSLHFCLMHAVTHFHSPLLLWELRVWVVQLLWFVQVLLETPQCIQILKFYSLAAIQFSQSTITVRAESVDGPTPAARVTWSTTAPLECVTSVRVEFRTQRIGPTATTYTATNTSQTEVIQTGLWCGTYYFITVAVVSENTITVPATVTNTSVQVLVEGK